MGLQVFYPPPLKLWTKLWIVHKITFYVKLWITVLRKINLWTIHNLWKIHKMHLEENCGQFVNCGSPSDFKKNCGQSTNFVDSSPQKIVDNPQILWTSMQFQAENPPQIPEIFACGAKNALEIAYSEVKIQKKSRLRRALHVKMSNFQHRYRTVARGHGFI